MKKNSNSVLEEHLQILDEMQEVGTDYFFYTRLRARMEAKNADGAWGFRLRPSLAIPALTILLVLNGFLLFHSTQNKGKQDNAYSIQRFAADYNQSIETIY